MREEFSPKVKIGSILFDADKGMAWTSLNADIKYFGVTVLMTPSTFLALVPSFKPNPDYLDKFERFVTDGNSISQPFLKISTEDGDSQLRVTGHEGRHRMAIALRLNGDEPVPVHIVDPLRRARRLSPEAIDVLRNGVFKQRAWDDLDPPFIKGPLFGDAFLSGVELLFEPKVDEQASLGMRS